MKKYNLIINSILLILLLTSNLYADGDKHKYEFKGDPDTFKAYKKFDNPAFNPYDDPNLYEQLIVDGKSPIFVVCMKEPYSYPFGGGKGVVHNLYYYYAIYGEVPSNKMTFNMTEGSSISISIAGIFEKVPTINNTLDLNNNEINGGTIKKFYLDGYKKENNTYVNKKLVPVAFYEKHLTLVRSEGFTHAYKGLNRDYHIYKPSDSQLKFLLPDNTVFQIGGPLPPVIQTEESTGLMVIPRMVQIAVIILVSLMGLLMVLKASLKALRALLGI